MRSRHVRTSGSVLPSEHPARRSQVGGARRVRTADPLLAKQVLSQLSYSPSRPRLLVGLGRFELPTSPLSGVRSNHLSYRPDVRRPYRLNQVTCEDARVNEIGRDSTRERR